MSQLFCEPTSPRDDHGILLLHHGQPYNIPFHFGWKGKTRYGELIDIEIDTTCRVLVRFKRDLRDKESVLEYNLPMLNNKNCLMLSIGEEDCRKLKAEVTYHLGMLLVDKNGKLIRTLLRDVPVKILGSVYKV